jgi:hypothetical protein
VQEAKLKSETSTALATMSKVILNVILLDVNLVTHEVTDHAPADNDGSQSAAGAAVTPRIPEDEASEDADIQLPDRNCKCCARMSCTSGYATFRTVQDVIYIIVNDFGFEIFITVVIVLNVLCMAISFYGMPQEMSDALDKLNYVSRISLYLIIPIYNTVKKYIVLLHMERMSNFMYTNGPKCHT